MGCSARFAAAVATAFPDDPVAACRVVTGLEPVRVLARSRTTETALVHLHGSGSLVRKRWVFPERRDRLRGVLRTTLAAASPAAREFDALTRLRRRMTRPFAPEPLGVLEERTHGFLRRCHLLLREVPAAVDLARWLHATRDPERRRAVLADLAAQTAEMHAGGLLDGDMHLRNVLVDADDRVWKVDCPRQRASTRALRPLRAAFDLACLDVGLSRLATKGERARFLVRYVRAAPARPAPHELSRRIDAARERIDAREARRLPR